MTVAGEQISVLGNGNQLLTSTRLPHADQFQGDGGPEDKVKLESERRPGDQDTLNLQDMKREGLAK